MARLGDSSGGELEHGSHVFHGPVQSIREKGKKGSVLSIDM